MKTSDKKYLEELQLALRLHDLSGPRVGEVMAEVETHLSETGEDPVQAFGHPREYAARVVDALPPNSGNMSAAEKFGGAFAVAALTYFGALFLVDGLVEGSVTFTRAEATTSAAFLLSMLVGVVLFFRAATAIAAKKRWAYGIAGSVASVVAIISVGPARWLIGEAEPLFELPRWGGIAVGVVLLVAATAMLVKAVKRGKVVDPR